MYTLLLSCLFLKILPNVQALALFGTTCYFPDGSEAFKQSPCSYTTVDGYSSCCNLVDSTCTQSGYCLGAGGVPYRGGCTDSNFVAASCVPRCTEHFPSGPCGLYSCADPGTYPSTWCCAIESLLSCCDNTFILSSFGNPVLPNATQTVTVVASSAASSTSEASSAASSSTSAASSSMTSSISASSGTGTSAAATGVSSSNNKNNATTIGVGVGVGLGVGLLAIAAVLYTIHTQRRKRQQAETPPRIETQAL